MVEEVKKERGITLVALVITVIIMLILAGVALSLITGEEGLFARTNHAASLYKDASQVEADKVGSVVSELEKYSGEPTPPTISEPTLITELALSGKLKVGDYIDYDAGKWEEGDLAKITASITAYGGTINNTVSDGETGNQALPTVQGEFGGFEIGDSRNSNSTPFSSIYTPRTEGWRIWDIDESTGEVTIIHAGHSETYYHVNGNGATSINILRNRDCSMYENKYAKEDSAHFLMGWEAAEWYTKNCGEGTEYTLGHEGDDGIVGSDERSFYYNNGLSTFVSASDNPVIEVLENHSYYWFASAYSTTRLFYVDPYFRGVRDSSYYAYGVRPLVSLQSDILLEPGEQTEGIWNTWKITGSAN